MPTSRPLRRLTRGALIAAIYAALTLLLAPISFGAVQVRLSEALAVLPVLFPEAVPALAVGCLLANCLGGGLLPDIVFGTLATLLGALGTRLLRGHERLALLPPVLCNGVIVGEVVHACYAPTLPLALCMLFVALGEALAVGVCGPLVLRAVRRVPEKYRR